MDFITLEKLSAYAFQESWNKSYYQKLKYDIDGLLESGVVKTLLEDEHIFYPKHLWQEEKGLELYFFNDEKLTIVYFEEDGAINIRTRMLEDISQKQINRLFVHKKDVELVITFTDGEKFVFSSGDSNDSWKYKYYDVIIEIHNRLF